MIDLSILLLLPQMKWIITLIAIDVVLGIIAALMKKDFRLGKLANFMFKPVLGYVFGFAIIALVPQAIPSLAMIAQVSYILIILALLGSILNNLARLGLKLPAYLKK
jgi:phage-related holin